MTDRRTIPAPHTPEPRWLTEEEQVARRAYLRGSRLLEQAMDEVLAPYGVQVAEYELISMLSEAPGCRLRMSQLAERIVQSRSRVTHTASRLEKRGWARREACADDKRGVELVLTADGMDALTRMAPAHVASVRANLVDLLTPTEFAALGAAMGKVRGHLRPDHDEIGGASGHGVDPTHPPQLDGCDGDAPGVA